MTIRIVTDSTSDLPEALAADLGITVVPAYVHFGEKTYRDGVDITTEELYERMEDESVHPTTSAPSPGDFSQAFRRLTRETQEIISISVTSKMSAIHKSAMIAADDFRDKCRIEVVDSRSVSMGLGLIAIAGAERAKLGGTLEEVMETIRGAIQSTNILAMLDTMKYALRGGRLNRASRILGNVIKVKPMITIKDGEIVPAGVVRTRMKAADRLLEFVRKRNSYVEELAVVHNTMPKDADCLCERLKALLPGKQPHMAKVGAGLGVHSGPGTLVVAFRERLRVGIRTEEETPRSKRFSLPSLKVPR